MSASGERVVPTAVFIVAFFAMTVLLVAGFNEMLTRAEQTKGRDIPSSSESLLAADLMLNLFAPLAQEANGTELDDENSYQLLDSFSLAGETDVGCLIARNWTESFFTNFDHGSIPSEPAPGECIHRSSHHDNPDFKPSDFLLFYQTWMGGTLALERRYRYDIIPFADLSSAHDAYQTEVGVNFTIVQMHLRYWVSGLVQWSRDADFYALDTQLWANKFNVSVATGFNATYGSISVTTVVGQLVGLRLPGVPMWIQAMIMIPFSIAVLLILVMIVTYFIP